MKASSDVHKQHTTRKSHNILRNKIQELELECTSERGFNLQELALTLFQYLGYLELIHPACLKHIC